MGAVLHYMLLLLMHSMQYRGLQLLALASRSRPCCHQATVLHMHNLIAS